MSSSHRLIYSMLCVPVQRNYLQTASTEMVNPSQKQNRNGTLAIAFYQAGIPLHNSDLSAKSCLMNILLPGKFRRLRPCQALRNQLRIASIIISISWPISHLLGPLLIFTSIRIGMACLSLWGILSVYGSCIHQQKRTLACLHSPLGNQAASPKSQANLWKVALHALILPGLSIFPLAGYMPPSRQNLGHWLGSTSNLWRAWRLWPGVLPYTSHIYTGFFRRCWKISANMPKPYCSFLTTNMTLKSSRPCSRVGWCFQRSCRVFSQQCLLFLMV